LTFASRNLQVNFVVPQANINADAIEDEVVKTIKNRLSSLPMDLFNITVNKEKEIFRLEQELKVKISKKSKYKKDQIDIFNQRELFAEEAYQQQLIELKKQIQYIDEEITAIEDQIKALLETIQESSTLEHYIEEFKQLDFGDSGKAKVLLHEIVKSITLTDSHLDLHYHYNFNQ
jgi:site-specific DNA recombinase